MVQLLGKTVWRFFKTLKIELPYNLAIPLPGIYPKKIKTLIQKDICMLMFTAALFLPRHGSNLSAHRYMNG